MDIREATGDDLEEIREVARETWHDTYDVLDAETIDAAVDEWYANRELEEAIQGWDPDGDLEIGLDDMGTVFLVAEADGEIVGFTHGIVQGDAADVLRMYVHPDHQGEGIGRTLHDHLTDELTAFDIEQIRALDLASNEASRAFYGALGFEQSDEGTVEIAGQEYDEAVYAQDV